MNCTIPAVQSTKFYNESDQHFSRLTDKQGQKVFFFFFGGGGEVKQVTFGNSISVKSTFCSVCS